MFGKAKYFTEFTYRCTVLKSIVDGNECRMGESFKNKIDDIISITPRKVKVKVWRSFSIKINESFKIQIKFYRINICNSE